MKTKRRKLRETNLTYAVIGLGRFGLALALELANMGADLVVVDHDPEKIKLLREVTENAFIADCTDQVALKKIGINNVDVAIVCIGQQIDISILIAMDLVNMGIPRVIAKAMSAKHGVILRKVGAEIVFPERDMAIRLANRLENSKTLDYVRLSEKVNITKVRVTDKGKDKSILDLKIRQKFGCNIIAVEHGSTVIDSVDPNMQLKKNDIIYVTGSKEHLDSLIKHI
ncbi:MAG: TrkA family potassium uptake protein [Bacilli bacterium]|nr:TrkA family potassium uptake protein [Bacilli bacterium]